MQLPLLLVIVVASISIMESAASNIRSLSVSTPFYELWRYGAPTDVVVTHLPGAVLIGGGPDCEAAFEHFILNANGGDMVVMRASGDDAYNDWIFGLSLNNPALKPLNSVTTIKWNGRQASFDPNVINVIRNAAAVFFAGGDQSMYLDFWSQTPVQSILQDKLIDTTMGGTSAGLAIMGNYIYPAHVGSAQSVRVCFLVLYQPV
jgi:cyanophycinase